MPETAENTATDKVQANWDALSSDPSFGDPSLKPTTEPKKEDEIIKDVIDPPAVEEKKEEKPVEQKPEPTQEAPVVEEITVSLSDITDAPMAYPQGSLKALAQSLGHEIKEESIDSFKEIYITKDEAQKQVKLSKDDIFATLKPETAAALELIEMGVAENLALEPTKEIDGYLKLEDAELVRANLGEMEGWTQDMIDTEIESLVENGKISHEAAKVRIELEQQKKAIIVDRTDRVQKYTAQKQESILRQKEQEKTQITETMNKVSTFMGVTIPEDVKKVFIAKYNNGLYDKELMSAESKVNYILNKELGDKIAKHIQNKASEKVKTDNTTQLLNIPPVHANGGGKVITNDKQDNWSAVESDFK